MQELVIDKTTYKMMKYVYRKNEVPLSEFNKKFNKRDVSSFCSLCRFGYAAYRTPEGKLTFETNDLAPTGTFGLTPLGNKYVEDRKSSFIRWILPILISTLALTTSVAALITSILLKNSEIFVHLIK